MNSHSDSESGGAQPTAHLVATPIHGRYLVRAPQGPPPWPVLVGFHGYGQDAGDHLIELERIPGTEAWLLVAVQALHPFYTRQQRVVANWMTRVDREQAIADNIAYVERTLADVWARHATRPPLVFAGFSQGGAMAYRAAAHVHSQGLIVLAADVPPDVASGTPVKLPPVLIGRGSHDEWYTAARQAADIAALDALGVRWESCVFDGVHEWSGVFRAAAGSVLRRMLNSHAEPAL